MTRFSQGKLAEIQDKKVKAGLTSGILTRKHQQDNKPLKDDPMVTSPVAKSKLQRLDLPTSSLELITLSNNGSMAKVKDKASIGSLWEDAELLC